MKPKQPKPKARVSRITVARLFNTGNYEHVRYELSVDVDDGSSAREALLDTVRILAGLKPLKKSYGYDQAKAILMKPYTEISMVEAEKIEEARKTVADYDGAVNYRNECLQRLDDIGGTRKHTDAKDNWDDSTPF
jgi:hypothetical protein